jgi:hypothetical protein
MLRCFYKYIAPDRGCGDASKSPPIFNHTRPTWDDKRLHFFQFDVCILSFGLASIPLPIIPVPIRFSFVPLLRC